MFPSPTAKPMAAMRKPNLDDHCSCAAAVTSSSPIRIREARNGAISSDGFNPIDQPGDQLPGSVGMGPTQRAMAGVQKQVIRGQPARACGRPSADMGRKPAQALSFDAFQGQLRVALGNQQAGQIGRFARSVGRRIEARKLCRTRDPQPACQRHHRCVQRLINDRPGPADTAGSSMRDGVAFRWRHGYPQLQPPGQNGCCSCQLRAQRHLPRSTPRAERTLQRTFGFLSQTSNLGHLLAELKNFTPRSSQPGEIARSQ